MAELGDGADAATNADALSARMANLHVPRESATLLSLPGELRNKIYDYCYEEKPILIINASSSHKKAGRFLALTQICRQIREEFRSLFFRKTTYELYIPEDLTNFMNTFYPRNVGLHIEKKYFGNIVVPVFHNLVELEYFNIEVGELFRLVAIAPGIHCTFKRAKCMPTALESQVAQLNSLLRGLQDTANPTWRGFILETVPEIELAVTQSSMRINFLLEDFDEADEYKSTIFKWWKRGSQPSAAISQLTVSCGITYDDVREMRDSWHGQEDNYDSGRERSQCSWYSRRRLS